MDCDTSNRGCNGGVNYFSFFYILANGGIDTEQNYPYRAWQRMCKPDRVGIPTLEFVQYEKNTMMKFLLILEEFFYRRELLESITGGLLGKWMRCHFKRPWQINLCPSFCEQLAEISNTTNS